MFLQVFWLEVFQALEEGSGVLEEAAGMEVAAMAAVLVAEEVAEDQAGM